MGTRYFQWLSAVLIMLAFMLVNGYSQNTVQLKKPNPETEQQRDVVKYKVTFIELGSVRCIPCQKMQPVMKSIETKYGKEVKVVFHDVWTPEGNPFVEQYGIEVIPTQVFIDENGKEFSLKDESRDFLQLLGTTIEVVEQKLEAYALLSAMLPTYSWFKWNKLINVVLVMNINLLKHFFKETLKIRVIVVSSTNIMKKVINVFKACQRFCLFR